jgi:hypothetical protein
MLLWLNDDKAREIDNDPSEVMFGESSESNMSLDEVCPFIGQCFGDRLYLKEGPSSTLSARIMYPGLMVRVTIREAPASGLASGAHRAHTAHARDELGSFRENVERQSQRNPCARVATRWSAMHVSTTLLRHLTMRRGITPYRNTPPPRALFGSQTPCVPGTHPTGLCRLA